MTKAELIQEYKRTLGISAGAAAENLNVLCLVMRAEFTKGGEVTLPGIGKLAVKTTAARKARNPRTGEAIDIPAGRKLVLKPGKEIKDFLK